VITIFATSASAQVESVDSPTEMELLVSTSQSQVTKREHLGTVASTNAQVTVNAITIATPNKNMQGIQLLLVDGEITETLYIGEKLLWNMVNELKNLYNTSQCEAQQMCIRGIARCRPSQEQAQAYCVAFYTTPNDETGTMLSTPTHSYKFPSIRPSELAQVIGRYN